MASELLVKRLLIQVGVSVLAGLLLSSATLAEDTSDTAEGSDISIEVNDPDVVIDPIVMGFPGPEISIDLIEIDSVGPDGSIEPMEMVGIAAGAADPTTTTAIQHGEGASAHGRAISRDEDALTGIRSIWTRTESLR